MARNSALLRARSQTDQKPRINYFFDDFLVAFLAGAGLDDAAAAGAS